MCKAIIDKGVIVASNASGAAYFASLGYLVIIVDVIDMSTSLEVALENGANKVFGASPDYTKAPVKVNPEKIGYIAGERALEINKGVIIISEPRYGKYNDRKDRCKKVLTGIKNSGASVIDIIPNIGAEVSKITNFENNVVICVSDTGGVAFDAAFVHSKDVTIGTIARTSHFRGTQPALNAANRAINLAKKRPIAVIAASSNSLEDLLAANYIYQLIINQGYLNLP